MSQAAAAPSRPASVRGPLLPASLVRAALWLAPVVVAIGLAWTYSDSYLHPTFAGDQGTRLDQADRVVVIMGPRRWLPFLQLHLHLLYLAHMPLLAYQLVPFAYTVATLFLVAALCRAALRDERQALAATVLLLIGFGGSSFHWLGRSLYQETQLLPLFLALVYLHYFAPRQRALFVAVFASGLLTREVFWIWWAVYLVLHWRGRLRDKGLRAGVAGLAVIPLFWLLYTSQSPLLSRNLPRGEPLLSGILDRAALLGQVLATEWILPSLVCMAVVFAIAASQRGVRGLAFRSYHIFSLLSVATTYAYVLLFDPWQTTPGNTRALVPLFAHIPFWWVIAWREATRLRGRSGVAARVATVAGILLLLKLTAIIGTFGNRVTDRPGGWEPLKLTTQLPPAGDWRQLLGGVVAPLRQSKKTPLEVAIVGVDGSEYRKLWVAPFLYDRRRLVATGAAVPPADIVIAPEGFEAEGWTRRERLHLPPDLVRDVLTR